MGWAMLYLFLFLKLPVAALLYLVWWAIRQNGDPTPVAAGPDGDGGTPSDDGGEPAGGDGGGGHPHDGWDRMPRRGRRGPHDEPQPGAPARVRPPALPEREGDPRTPHA